MAVWVVVVLLPGCSGVGALRSIHEDSATSAAWIRGKRIVDPNQHMTLNVQLMSVTPEHELAALIESLTDARSRMYGQYLTLDAMRPYWTAPTHVLSTLLALVQAHPNASVQHNLLGDSVELRMPVAHAEALFNTTIHEYSHRTHSSLQLLRPHSTYIVPHDLAPHVVFIDGLESFPTEKQAMIMAQKRSKGPDEGVAQKKSPARKKRAKLISLAPPKLIREVYEMPANPRELNGTHERNRLVVAAFLDEYYTESDLQKFAEKHEAAHIPKSFLWPSHDGACMSTDNPSGAGATGEASLDVQVAISLTWSEKIGMQCMQKRRLPSQPYADFNQEPFLAFFQRVNEMDPPPAVVSVSYTDDECAVPRGYAKAVNRELMKAAMRGISVVIAAGDAGVVGSHMSNGYCAVPYCSKFLAMFPASSPYVTTVGATTFYREHDGNITEKPTSVDDGGFITSGGGFSSLFPRPSYQDEFVKAYLKHASDPPRPVAPRFPRNGRAYPDVAACGHGFPVLTNGFEEPTDGTSVSAPVMASLFVLINKHRLEHGQPVLGFANPLLYQMAKVCPYVFRDVVEGDIGCGKEGMQCCVGAHRAMVGWDAVSGLGSLRFKTFIKSFDHCMKLIKDQAEPQQQDFVPYIQLQGVSPNDWSSVERWTVHLIVATALVVSVVLVSALMVLRSNLFLRQPTSSSRPRLETDPVREYLLAHEGE